MKRQITVYSLPNCSQCRMTKMWLDKNGIEYKTVDLLTSPDDAAAVQALGYTAAPVVIVSNGDPETDIHWFGFNVGFLAKYAAGEVA